jgi:hypothetical protein
MNRFIIGEIMRVNVKDELFIKNDIQVEKLNTIGRPGGRRGDLYCPTTNSFEMHRPTLTD